MLQVQAGTLETLLCLWCCTCRAVFSLQPDRLLIAFMTLPLSMFLVPPFLQALYGNDSGLVEAQRNPKTPLAALADHAKVGGWEGEGCSGVGQSFVPRWQHDEG